MDMVIWKVWELHQVRIQDPNISLHLDAGGTLCTWHAETLRPHRQTCSADCNYSTVLFATFSCDPQEFNTLLGISRRPPNVEQPAVATAHWEAKFKNPCNATELCRCDTWTVITCPIVPYLASLKMCPSNHKLMVYNRKILREYG